MAVTRERPTIEDLAGLLLEQEPEEKHDDTYFRALADQFRAATEVEEDPVPQISL